MHKPIDPEKLRTMIRSILPSIARKGARHAKANENRRVRRKVRHDLRTENEKGNPWRDSHHGDTVRWRRGADKLNHFMRWCEALTKGMTYREALDHIRALLPPNVIGDHAYGHWEAHRRPSFDYIRWKEQQRREAQSLYDRTVFALRRLLAEDPQVLGELNAEIKRRKLDGEPRRPLFGMHDVEAFIRDVYASDQFNLERRILNETISGRPSGRPRSLAA